VFTGVDNFGAFVSINAGRSRSSNAANEVLMSIFELCYKWNIDICATWVPRDDNTVSDDLSKPPLSQLRLRFPSLVVVPDPLAPI
jgi:hypothetical protein